MSKFKTFSVPVEVRFSDLDAYGHVNNAVFFTYLEMARVKVFSNNFTGRFDGDSVFFVSRASCEYLRPIPLQSEIFVEISVARLKRGSVDLAYRLTDGEETLFATAETTLVSVDPTRNRPTRVPDWLPELLRGGSEEV